MYVLYVSFGSKVRPRTFGCIAMGSDLLFIVRSRLLVYSTQVEHITPIAQLVSALDFNFERAVEGSILTASKRLSLKNLNVIIRAIN